MGWYSNCFKFDEKIAANLGKIPGSFINLSIDSGTPETWKKVKGYDNFHDVLENVREYSANAIRSEQILFKYILMPGINDSYADYLGCIDLMKGLGLKRLDISRDIRKTYTDDATFRNKLIDSARRYRKILIDNHIEPQFMQWSSEEVRMVME